MRKDGLVIVLLLLLYFDLNNSEEPSLRYITRPKCRNDADCHPHAFCYGNDVSTVGYCKCSTGYQMYSSGKYYECLTESRLGEECKRDIQCQIHAGTQAHCNDLKGICECNSTISHAVAGVCYDTKFLNEFCQVDANCLLPESLIGEDDHAICSSGVCSCPIGKRPSESRKRCVEYKKLDERCTNDLQCQFTANSVCRTRCTCEAGFTRSSDRFSCIRAAVKFGDSCSESVQCSRYLERSICENKICTCPQHYHEYETRCRRNVMPGETCFDTGDCVSNEDLEGRIDCIKGVCTCYYGKSYNEDICLPNNASIKSGSIWLFLFLIVLIYRV